MVKIDIYPNDAVKAYLLSKPKEPEMPYITGVFFVGADESPKGEGIHYARIGIPENFFQTTGRIQLMLEGNPKEFTPIMRGVENGSEFDFFRYVTTAPDEPFYHNLKLGDWLGFAEIVPPEENEYKAILKKNETGMADFIKTAEQRVDGSVTFYGMPVKKYLKQSIGTMTVCDLEKMEPMKII